MIWFRAKTSKWHLWRLTPKGREGKQWAECLEVVYNPVTYVDKLPTRGRWTIGPVCVRCSDYYRYIKENETSK